MPITDPSDSIQASWTDGARQYLARVTLGQLAFQAVGFSVGRGGYQPLDAVHLTPLVLSNNALDDQVYPNVTGYSPFDAIEEPSTSCRVYDCRLPNTVGPSNADYGLGEVAIWAQILRSNVGGEVGLVFLMALAHMPIKAKTNAEAYLLRVVTQY
jgi:hypothetical protein